MMMNLFSFVYPQFKFGKTINVIECFSGIGTQAMALKRLAKKHDLDINITAISEIDKYAIQSYEAIHGKVNNLGGIGSFDRFPSGVDLCTWSFPCQDISLAGKQKGMKDGTRSNYGYEFLDTVKRTPYNERPKVLLMENVPALVSEKFKDDYTEIHYRLEQLGYTSWGGLMNAKDYGIPQNRERIFVLSFLGEYAYTFPRPIKLKTRLKDYLEPIVDEKYYLSDKQIEQIVNWKAYNKPLENARSENDETIQTMVVGEYRRDEGLRTFKDGAIGTLRTNDAGGDKVVVTNPPPRIRKLTPLEAWRLMGIDDEDFYKAKATGMSDSQLYKQAGNAIVVNVLEALLKEMI